ncbi:MAG: hypothetical protein CVU89_06930 [Firmicutes bacterium HGW-Firmicutes-14]|nr:MAG: hypothetical protein CVU89_06930 [Firmicutes bacterium HGW-Firmicutes-14]
MIKPNRKILIIFLALALFISGTSSAGAYEPDSAAVPLKSAGEGISVDLHHILLESADNNTVTVREVLTVNNSLKKAFEGEEAVDGDKKAAFTVSLPGGYTSLQVSSHSKESVVAGPDRVVLTSPLVPGTTQVVLSYEMPIGSSELVFAKTVNYPTEILYVLSPKGQLDLKGDQGILDYGTQNLEGTEYRVFLIEKALPDREFTLTMSPDRVGRGYTEKSGFHSISHLQRWNSSPLAATDPHMWVAVIIILFFGAVAAGGYYLKRKHREQRLKEKEERLAGLLDELVIRQKKLLNKIDSLDRKNEGGEIGPEEYGDLRKQYMDKLVRIKLKKKELENLEEAGAY